MKKYLLNKYYIVIALLLIPSFGLEAVGIKIDNPLRNVDSIQTFVAKILEFVVKVGTVVAVFAVIWTGFLFIKAQGNPTEIAKAKAAFFWVVVGGVVLIGAQVLSQVICKTAEQLGAPAGTC